MKTKLHFQLFILSTALCLQTTSVWAQAEATCEQSFAVESVPAHEIDGIHKSADRLGLDAQALDEIFKLYSAPDAQTLRHILSDVGRGTSITDVTLIRAFLKLRLLETGSNFTLTPAKLMRMLEAYKDTQKLYLLTVLDNAYESSVANAAAGTPITNEVAITSAIKTLPWPGQLQNLDFQIELMHTKIGVPDPETIAPGLMVAVTDRLSDKQVSQVTAVWDRLKKLIVGDRKEDTLGMPEKILVNIGFRASNASDDADGGVLQTIYQFQKEKILNPEVLQSKDFHDWLKLKVREERKHPVKTVPVFAHELGHAILGENIRSRVPAWSEQIDPIRAHMKQSQDQIKSIGAQATALLQTAIKEKDPELKKSILAQVRDLDNQMMDLSKQSLELGKQLAEASGLTVGYNEFFADSVAVLDANDPDAIYNALHYTGDSPKEVARQKLRSFSARNGTSDDYNNDPHATLAQVRSYVGHRYYFTAPYSLNKARTLRTVLDAIGRELEERMTKPELKTLSNREINHRLIQKIDEEFKKY